MLRCEFPNFIHFESIHTDNAVLENLLPNVVDGAIALVLDTQGPDQNMENRNKDFTKEPLPSQFQFIFDEASGWVYGQ